MSPMCSWGVFVLLTLVHVTVTSSGTSSIIDQSKNKASENLGAWFFRHLKIPRGHVSRNVKKKNTGIVIFQKKSTIEGSSCMGICNYCANHESGSLTMGDKCQLYCVTSGEQNRNFYDICQYIIQNKRFWTKDWRALVDNFDISVASLRFEVFLFFDVYK